MRVSWVLFLVFLSCSQLARGDPFRYEFLLLPSAQAIGTFDRHAASTQIHDEVVQADTLLTLQWGRFKVFGEYLLSDHERDLERLQLGWQFSDDTILWVGRFHQPTSVWNHDHHHGQYLQTSITRPAIDEWEDIGGVLPQHFTGALLESGASVFRTWRLRTALGGGIAPQLNQEGMDPYDLLRPDSHRHQLGYQARASLHPGDFTETGVGIALADDNLTAVEPLPAAEWAGFDHVNLRLVGVFATYAGVSWKLTGTVYYADARLYFNTRRLNDSFVVGYVQAEWRFAHELTGFARWEDSAGAQHSPYLHLFDQVARTRRIAGLRWDFLEHQALTVQFASSHTLDGRFNDLRLQWSAAFF
jgi:hypothetical protein